MVIRSVFFAVAMLVPVAAFAAPQNYAVACSSGCAVQSVDAQGNPTTVQEPAGYVDNVIILDPSTAHGFAAPGGHVLIGGTGLSIGQTATANQLANGVTQIP